LRREEALLDLAAMLIAPCYAVIAVNCKVVVSILAGRGCYMLHAVVSFYFAARLLPAVSFSIGHSHFKWSPFAYAVD
jgi:uncharacterized membrane protein